MASHAPDDFDVATGPDDDTDTRSDGATRRGFLGLMTVVLGSVPILGALFTSLRTGFAPMSGTRPQRIPLCKLGDVPEAGIKEIAVSYEVREGPRMSSVARVVFVTRDPETRGVIALDGECTHLSCPVQTRTLTVQGTGESAPLTCPCHGGMFSQTGKRLAGPPRSDLRRLKLAEPLPTDPAATIYLLEA